MGKYKKLIIKIYIVSAGVLWEMNSIPKLQTNSLRSDHLGRLKASREMNDKLKRIANEFAEESFHTETARLLQHFYAGYKISN